MYFSQQLATQAVQQVLAGKNLGVCLDQLVRAYPQITPQQRAVMQDLSYGTLRHLGRLQALLKQLLERPLRDERVRCLLLVALYQLEFTEAQAHTVVDQAVKASAMVKQVWAKGLVNGVLRNFLRRQPELVLALEGDEEAQYSYPTWWIAKLKAQYPQHWETMLQVGNVHPPMTLRVNRRKTSAADYLALLRENNMEAMPLGEVGLMLSKPVGVDQLPHFRDGWVSVQDWGAQCAAQWLDVQDGMHVLDACCAPGGKTGHLLETADIRLLALDSDEARLPRTQDNVQRLGLSATFKVGDATSHDWWDGVPFDRILADVPCSASGIVRRHVDIKWLRRAADIASFTQQQAAILPSLWKLLAKGGKLLYVTCSVFQEENQRQIDRFLKQQTDAVQLPLPAIANQSSGHLIIEHGQLLPNAQHDGFFYALLQKN